MKLLVLAFFTLVVSGCSVQWHGPTATTLYPDRDLQICSAVRPELNRGIRDAADMWNRSLANWRHVVQVSSNCDIEILETNEPTRTSWAWTSELGGGTILLNIAHLPAFSRHTASVVGHEVGHALGAQHLPGTLMQLHWDGLWECPDAATVAQVAAYHRINLELLAWCWK